MISDSILPETPPKPALLPNPWTSPGPKSTEQPQLVVKHSHFTNKALKCHSGEYPYELPTHQPHQIPFHEFIGHGPPPSDVAGNPGDVYVDLNSPCKVYVREMGGWAWWDWSLVSRNQYAMPPEHPILSNRYLWVVTKTPSFQRAPSRLSWLTRQSLKTYRYIKHEEVIPEVYQGLPAPSSKEGNKLQIKKNRSRLEDHNTLTSLGVKRDRSPSLIGSNQDSASSSNTPGSDVQPKKKTKLTHDEERDTGVVEKKMSLDSEKPIG